MPRKNNIGTSVRPLEEEVERLHQELGRQAKIISRQQSTIRQLEQQNAELSTQNEQLRQTADALHTHSHITDPTSQGFSNQDFSNESTLSQDSQYHIDIRDIIDFIKGCGQQEMLLLKDMLHNLTDHRMNPEIMKMINTLRYASPTPAGDTYNYIAAGASAAFNDIHDNQQSSIINDPNAAKASQDFIRRLRSPQRTLKRVE